MCIRGNIFENVQLLFTAVTEYYCICIGGFSLNMSGYFTNVFIYNDIKYVPFMEVKGKKSLVYFQNVPLFLLKSGQWDKKSVP